MVWTDELTGAVEQENFLLDKGRLKLKTIQQAFSASLVRMCIGNFCILVRVILLMNITRVSQVIFDLNKISDIHWRAG